MVGRARRKVHFESGGTRCSAWHYPGSDGSVVVMAGGFAATKEPATDRFAARFQQSGHGVLGFDFRGTGESAGYPRQVVRVADQLADWRAAIEFARGLPGVAPDRVAAWGFSLSGGHLLRIAAEDLDVAAVIAQTPFVGGPAASLAVARHQSAGAMGGVIALAILDTLRGWLGRPPRLIDLAGPKGATAFLTTPDALQGDAALNAGNRYPDWIQQVAARSVIGLAGYRPATHARKIRRPLLVVVCDADVSALAAAASKVADTVPEAELARFPGGHYAPFMEAHEDVVQVELEFLSRHVSKQTQTAPVGGTQ